MKNFDLEAAKRGAAVCTRRGQDVRIVCFDRLDSVYPIVGLCRNNNGSEFIEIYTSAGSKFCISEDGSDLMMRDDDYLEKLERGEYDHIADARKMVGPAIKQNLTTDREYWRWVYAGQAMQGIVSALDMNAPIAEDGVASMACAFADALIEELEKTETK